MSASPSDPLDIPRTLLSSGFLGLKGFWKVSSVSKKLLALRDDATLLGFGSVCSGFTTLSEREEAWNFFDDCFARDDVKALKQMLALKGVAGRYPSLLRRLMLVRPHSQKCAVFLMETGHTALSGSGLSHMPQKGLTNLPREGISAMLQNGSLSPNEWVERIEMNPVEFTREDRCCLPQPTFRLVQVPLLSNLITAGNFEGAGVLLDAGARVDVCPWETPHAFTDNPSRNPVPEAGVSPLFGLIDHWNIVRCYVQSMKSTLAQYDEPPPSLLQNLDVVEEKEREAHVLLHRLIQACRGQECLGWRERPPRPRKIECELGVTALGFACAWRDAEMVKALLEGEAGEKWGPRRSDLVFLALCENGLGEGRGQVAQTLAALASHGVDLNVVQRGRGAHSSMSLACSLGLVNAVKLLIEKGVGVQGVMLEGGRKRTPLIEAVGSRNPSVVSLVLEMEADVNELGIVGGVGGEEERRVSPLQAILLPKQEDGDASVRASIVELLLRRGASCTIPPLSSTQGQSVASPPVCMSPPLLLACRLKDARLVRLLCERGGADPNEVGETPERTQTDPLSYAISCCVSSGIATWLPPHKVDSECAEIVGALIDAGADLSREKKRSSEGDRPGHLSRTNLLWAIYLGQEGMPETVDTLLKGAERVRTIVGEGGERMVPLCAAIMKGQFSVAKVLLQRGADPNELTYLIANTPEGLEKLVGFTPLQLVIESIPRFSGPGHINVTRALDLMLKLLEAGARHPPPQLPLSDQEGGSPRPPLSDVSPLLAALSMKSSGALREKGFLQFEVIRLLIEKGGMDPNVPSRLSTGLRRRLGEPVLPLVMALTNLPRPDDLEFDAWLKMVESLIKLGADPFLLSSVSNWPSSSEHVPSQWLTTLIQEFAQKHTGGLRGDGRPILLKLIQHVHLRELEKATEGNGDLGQDFNQGKPLPMAEPKPLSGTAWFGESPLQNLQQTAPTGGIMPHALSLQPVPAGVQSPLCFQTAPLGGGQSSLAEPPNAPALPLGNGFSFDPSVGLPSAWPPQPSVSAGPLGGGGLLQSFPFSLSGAVATPLPTASSPLNAALRCGWKEGVAALIERGVKVGEDVQEQVAALLKE
uniref:Uncharacterized protein n=1 Tax=Chromera velia CCMP2878 TaxID=1169474 RepID=A0A0G4HX43_9ALVE|eukprot:Cvel_9163.t1-p1 / transcript=Cvel_9163.t1 / gene=Cvel_9163 / organism=Chromera_velia_CCMP2878 / gene_product=hypothetical protein / transcript_product=hypothetical protein / location=Cvel_scaffold521:69778-73729(+) / protein_length=1099 / sequence_SO=supercontig / SO=protein_coding / is_pseudo=false